jgi:hypothetical protein
MATGPNPKHRSPLEKHPHKGPASKRNDLRNIPLIVMSEEETEDILLSGDRDEPLLEARHRPATDVALVGAILRLSNGEE